MRSRHVFLCGVESILCRHSQRVEPLPTLAPIGHHAAEKGVVVFAVVMLDEVAKFVHDHIVDQCFFMVNQLEVEGDCAVGAATAPTGFHAAD